MAIHTKLELHDAIYIGEQFGLDVKSSGPIKEGLRNSSYLLETHGISRYILRICEGKTQEQAKNLVELIEYLFDNGFPSQEPVRASNGSQVNHEGKPVIMLKYIEGNTIKDLTTKQLDQLGQCIAKMHMISTPEFLSQQHPFGFEAYKKIIRSIDSDYIGWFNQKKEYFERTIPDDLPKGIIHGDLWYDNAIYHEDNLAGIIDFESGHQGNCIFDIGQTIIGTCRMNGSLDYNKAKALVDGYQKVRPLEDTEKELLKTAAAHAAAVISIWRFHYFSLQNGNGVSEMYLDAVNLSERLNTLENKKFMNVVFGYN
ncbi:homoserine kinase [Candidatus Woesearchaeota archaeon]|jgi:homoserine kinase type II|nr:homoserine kinase [Candidatus Woesearchaeota archaeon]